MATERYAGHDSGMECVNDGRGNFSYRPLTPAELLARAPAAQIQDDIYKHANSAGVCYYPIFKLIAAAIQAGMDQVRAGGVAQPLPAHIVAGDIVERVLAPSSTAGVKGAEHG